MKNNNPTIVDHLILNISFRFAINSQNPTSAQNNLGPQDQSLLLVFESFCHFIDTAYMSEVMYAVSIKGLILDFMMCVS